MLFGREPYGKCGVVIVAFGTNGTLMLFDDFLGYCKSNNDEDPAKGFVSIDGGTPPEGMMENGAMGAGDENCLVQINGDYIVISASGDGIDSNGSIEVNDGVVLVSGPASGDNGALDYDISATVNGGTVIAVGSAQMAQNFSGGDQPFAYTSVNGSAGDSIAIIVQDGTVLCSYAPDNDFGMVAVTCPQFVEGTTYSVVVGGDVSDANEDGYADTGSVSGGTSTSITVSVTASGGLGGLAADGMGMPAGQPGDIRQGSREESSGQARGFENTTSTSGQDLTQTEASGI